MYDPRSERVASPKVEKLSTSLENLRWASRVLKELPNLPNGKLRDSLETDIRNLIASDPLESESTIVALRQELDAKASIVSDLQAQMAQRDKDDVPRARVLEEYSDTEGRTPWRWRLFWMGVGTILALLVMLQVKPS